MHHIYDNSLRKDNSIILGYISQYIAGFMYTTFQLPTSNTWTEAVSDPKLVNCVWVAD
jgi:hypothetical protein